MTILDTSGRPIASAIKNRINEQPGDENMPNLTGAGNGTIEIDARLDGSYRLSVIAADGRVDIVMKRDDLAQLIAELIRVGGFR